MNANGNKYTYSRIDFITEKVISSVMQETGISYDAVLPQFQTSVTYQLLNDIQMDYFEKDAVEVLAIWKEEQRMDRFLEDKIPKETDPNQANQNYFIRQNLKRKALLENKCIEEIFYSSLYPNKRTPIHLGKSKNITPSNF